MADDDLLRSVLEREARQVPMQRDAAHALVALEPALRRAAFKRASLIAASTVLVLGGTAAAVNVMRPTDDEISVISSVPATSTPESSTVRTAPDNDDDGTSRDDADDAVVPSPIEVDGDDGRDAALPSTVPTTSRPSTSTAGPSTSTSTTSTVGDAPTQPTAPTTVPATIPQPDTSPPTTTPATTQPPTRFDSSCGYVMADLATSPPTIVEVVPAPGYRYRLEDPDGDSITVQFTGGGEDCEVKIGEADHADHAARSEPVESSDD